MLDHIEQEKPHLDPAVGHGGHATDDDRVRTTGRPVTVADLFGAGGARNDPARVDQLEQAAARKVVPHDLGHAERIGTLPGERDDRDGDRRGAATHDFDGELRAGHACREDTQD